MRKEGPYNNFTELCGKSEMWIKILPLSNDAFNFMFSNCSADPWQVIYDIMRTGRKRFLSFNSKNQSLTFDFSE